MTDATEAALLAAIVASPSDDTRRKAYADFIQERDGPGDAARAAYIGASIAIEQLGKCPHWCGMPQPVSPAHYDACDWCQWTGKQQRLENFLDDLFPAQPASLKCPHVSVEGECGRCEGTDHVFQPGELLAKRGNCPRCSGTGTILSTETLALFEDASTWRRGFPYLARFETLQEAMHWLPGLVRLVPVERVEVVVETYSTGAFGRPREAFDDDVPSVLKRLMPNTPDHDPGFHFPTFPSRDAALDALSEALLQWGRQSRAGQPAGANR